LELLREVVPTVSYIAVLWNAASPIQVIEERGVQAAAQISGMKMLSLGVPTIEEIEDALTTIVRERPGALLVLDFSSVAQSMSESRLPSVRGSSGESRLKASKFDRLSFA